MVAWSALHGLGGLQCLQACLSTLDGTCTGNLTLRTESGGVVHLDSGGQSMLATGSSALDLAIAIAAEQGGAEVIVHRCRDPVFAVALAVRASGGGHHVRLRWSSVEKTYQCDANAGDCIFGIAPKHHDSLEQDDLHISLRSGADIAQAIQEQDVIWMLSPECVHTALAEGIVVADELWESLIRYGRRMLVTATDESRARGAGGGDANE